MTAVAILDPRALSLFRDGEVLEQLATGAIWSEGPVWMREDGSVLWSDIPNNRMLRWHPTAGTSVWRDSIEFTNGHAREANGALLHCSHGQRAIVRTILDDQLNIVREEIVVDRYRGRRLNSPNDVIVARDGCIWFTDPPYGILSDREGHKAEPEMAGNYVFRFDPRTNNLELVAGWLEEPNGLAFSPDERILYVSDTSAALRTEGGRHEIMAFDVVGDGLLAHPRTFAVIEPGLPDGFDVDTGGHIFTSSENGVKVYRPDGTLIADIPVPEKVGNLTFGGPDRDELYICASTSLYRLKVTTQGTPRP